MSAYGVDQFYVKAVIDLFAQMADVDVDDIGGAGEVIIPDMLFQPLSGQNDAGISHHVAQQRIFF